MDQSRSASWRSSGTGGTSQLRHFPAFPVFTWWGQKSKPEHSAFTAWTMLFPLDKCHYKFKDNLWIVNKGLFSLLSCVKAFPFEGCIIFGGFLKHSYFSLLLVDALGTFRNAEGVKSLLVAIVVRWDQHPKWEECMLVSSLLPFEKSQSPFLSP